MNKVLESFTIPGKEVSLSIRDGIPIVEVWVNNHCKSICCLNLTEGIEIFDYCIERLLDRVN